MNASLPPTPLPLTQPDSAGYTSVELDPEADRAAMIDVDEWAFAFATPPEALDQLQFEPEAGRSVGVRHDASGDLVAMHSSYEGTLVVPGGEIPAAGLTWVGVHPGHRRKGLATTMLTTHLARTAARGEPVSVLFAAEPEIYGRFGYGHAATTFGATLGRGATLRPVLGSEDLHCTLERAQAERHGALVTDLLAQAARPGEFRPASEAPRHNRFVEIPAWRENAELRRIAIVRDGEGTARAFATFRRTEKWDETGPRGTLQVGLWAALDGAASRCLFETLTSLDLMASIKLGSLTMDSPLLLQLVNLRSAALRAGDNLWLRIVDLPATLAARTYGAPFDVTLAVTDEGLPGNAGRWRVRGGADGAQVERLGEIGDGGESAATGDLELDTATLARAYLGGTSLTALAQAGLVRVGDPAALAAASVAFTGQVQPVCAVGF